MFLRVRYVHPKSSWLLNSSFFLFCLISVVLKLGDSVGIPVVYLELFQSPGLLLLSLLHSALHYADTCKFWWPVPLWRDRHHPKFIEGWKTIKRWVIDNRRRTTRAQLHTHVCGPFLVLALSFLCYLERKRIGFFFPVVPSSPNALYIQWYYK